jgi:WD40 repeat protein
VAFSDDGKHLAAGSLDGTIKLWDAGGKEVHNVKGHEGVWAIAFSPDSKRLATGGWDQRVKIWDVASGKEVQKIGAHDKTVSSIAFSPDGQRIASGGLDNVIRIWTLKK